ncbi:DEAD/DEAH box helicase [Cerasicoccus fimbriatus]|uniref:DEAD/DEAH box helicase n=1 Tax=Cerasicoccus fimbriatus TaxID=3014554 RepID=UPI0022B31A99|nr:ATP-binding domain-containing protein [Cerasicoccus sp. TK19100]
MPSSFFYLGAEKTQENEFILNGFAQYAEQNNLQTYIIDRPLGEDRYTYGYEKSFLLLIPKHKITFINYGPQSIDFDDYIEDFLEDLGSISDKFRYKEFIGRPRKWRSELVADFQVDSTSFDPECIISQIALTEGEKQRSIELIISLLTGSINDISKLQRDMPEAILDKLKQKILLFDGEQTRFIYDVPVGNEVIIQGLSGTGKTELLLHKLKEIYTADSESRIIFTCHNKILASNLRQRIPEFFNFMKVEEQIEWDHRLWCISAWGSSYDRNSGTYRYICDKYNLSFNRFSYTYSFDDACTQAIAELSKIDGFDFAFDYALIDESQDFPESFFELMKLVTAKTVYRAGDIFQSIFDTDIISEIAPDFLLSKCYRTDPRTLMFAHALGMGLFEKDKLRWLEDPEWQACGYVVNKDPADNNYTLTREPLRRFEDLVEEGDSSVEIVEDDLLLAADFESEIISLLVQIVSEHPTVQPDDIAVIFIDRAKYTYNVGDRLSISVPERMGWRVNKAYESKRKSKGALFVSNKNNVKGLEFPFVICVTQNVLNTRSYRNALYMMMTRSFLKSFLIISKQNNEEFIDAIGGGLESINETGSLIFKEPTQAEKSKIKTTILQADKHTSFYDYVYEIFDEFGVETKYRSRLYKTVESLLGPKFDHDSIYEVIAFSYSRIQEG